MKHSANNAPVQWTLHPQKLATTVFALTKTPNIGLNV